MVLTQSMPIKDMGPDINHTIKDMGPDINHTHKGHGF